MSTIRPNAKITIDNSDAHGRIEKHGFGYDWRFDAKSQADPTAADVFAPTWLLNGCEIIPALNALGLRGYAVRANMSLDSWTIEAGEGYWRETTLPSRPAVTWLAWTDGRANRYGAVRSNGTFEPRIAVWLMRFVPPPDQTDPVFVEISLHGDGLAPAYTLQIPLHDATYKYPRLWRHDVGADAPELVDEWQRVDAQAIGLREGATFQAWWIEETDGLLIITAEGVSEPWVYDCGGEPPATGPVSVVFRGHCGMFNLQPITYPLQGTATPLEYVTVPDWQNASAANYLAVSSPRGEGAVTVTDDAANQYQHRPVITLQRFHPNRRPIVYLVHQYHPATFSSPRSDPVTTSGRHELIRVTWTRRWPRGWEFTATLRDPDGYWADRVSLNKQAALQAGWDGSYTDIMVGYLRRPGRVRGSGLQRQIEIEAEDYTLARLAEKKFMVWPCTPEGWNLAEWLQWVLNRAGIPDSLLDIESTTIVVPRQRRKRSQYEFGHDAPLLRAVDELLAAYGWVLGVRPDGKIWAGPEPTYSGTPDYVLDSSSMTADNIVASIEANSEAELRNYAAVFYGDTLQAAIWADQDSHKTPTADDFIGDDWWQVEIARDNPNPDARAYKLLQQGMRERVLLKWQMVGNPSLLPGAFVRLDIDGLGVPTGTVFRIVEERAVLDNSGLSFQQEFVAELVEA